jgi:hypothetical protein
MTETQSTLMDVIQFARPLKTVGLARLLLEESQYVLLYVLLQILLLLDLTLAQTMIALDQMDVMVYVRSNQDGAVLQL